jgi:hypothetical protein
MFNGNILLAFNYGFLLGVGSAFVVLLLALNWKPDEVYNKSAVMRVIGEHCYSVLSFVINGDLSVAQIICDLSNSKITLAGLHLDPNHGSVLAETTESHEDEFTINSMSYNTNIKNGTKVGRANTLLELQHKVGISKEDSESVPDAACAEAEANMLQAAVEDIEAKTEAWNQIGADQSRIEDLAERAVKERHISIKKNRSNSSNEESISGIQLLESDFRSRREECRLRQKEIKKFIGFLGDLGKCFGKFSGDITKLSKDANNISNALMADAANGIAMNEANSNIQPSQSNNDLNIGRDVGSLYLESAWKGLSVYLSHSGQDSTIVSTTIQLVILPQLSRMLEELVMFEKNLNLEGDKLLNAVKDAADLYDRKLKERQKMKEKLDKGFEQQIAKATQRRLTLAVGKMGASQSLAKAVGFEAAASQQKSNDGLPEPNDTSPIGERPRRTSVLDIIPESAAEVAAIGMGTNSNILTKAQQQSNEKLTLQLQESEEECDDLLQELNETKEKLKQYLPRVLGDFERIAVKSDIELRTHLMSISQKVEASHEKGVPACYRLRVQIAAVSSSGNSGADGLSEYADHSDLVRVLKSMVKQRSSSSGARSKCRINRASIPCSPVGSPGSYASPGSPSSLKLDSQKSIVSESRIRFNSSDTSATDFTNDSLDDQEVNPTLDVFAETTAHLAATPLSKLPQLPPCFNSAIPTESAVWFNAFLGRIYRDISVSPYFHNYFCSRATSSLNRGKRPAYIDSFKVSEVTFGSMPPSLCNVRWNPVASSDTDSNDKYSSPNKHQSDNSSGTYKLTMDGHDEANPDNTVIVSADVSFRSGIAFTIETKLRLLRNRMVVNIKLFVEVLELTGSCQIGVLHSRSFFTFLEEPHLYVNIRSEVGNSDQFKLLDVPQLGNLIRVKLHSFITKKMVSPNKHYFRLPHPRAWWPKGTEDFFTGSSNQKSKVDPLTGLRSPHQDSNADKDDDLQEEEERGDIPTSEKQATPDDGGTSSSSSNAETGRDLKKRSASAESESLVNEVGVSGFGVRRRSRTTGQIPASSIHSTPPRSDTRTRSSTSEDGTNVDRIQQPQHIESNTDDTKSDNTTRDSAAERQERQMRSQKFIDNYDLHDNVGELNISYKNDRPASPVPETLECVDTEMKEDTLLKPSGGLGGTWDFDAEDDDDDDNDSRSDSSDSEEEAAASDDNVAEKKIAPNRRRNTTVTVEFAKPTPAPIKLNESKPVNRRRSLLDRVLRRPDVEADNSTSNTSSSSKSKSSPVEPIQITQDILDAVKAHMDLADAAADDDDYVYESESNDDDSVSSEEEKIHYARMGQGENEDDLSPEKLLGNINFSKLERLT